MQRLQRLSGLDASFLYLETPTQPLHVCSVLELDASTIPGGYTFERLVEEMALRIKAIPTFREKLSNTFLNLDHPVWVEDEEFDIQRHVHRIGLPAPGGRVELAEICGHLASLPLDRRHPLWEMWVIEGLDGTDARAGGRLAVLTKVHHAAVDGVTGANLMSQLCSVEPDAPAPEPVEAAADVDPLRIVRSAWPPACCHPRCRRWSTPSAGPPADGRWPARSPHRKPRSTAASPRTAMSRSPNWTSRTSRRSKTISGSRSTTS
jgi:WS/DGAT/MGAT family acyltransferase